VSIVTMRELLESGVHYGHHTSRWNPKMARYIYKQRHSIHIIDLRETARGLVRAYRFLSVLSEQGGDVVLVGTKKQAEDPVSEQAGRANVHYVSERWLGGTLTNFDVVMGRVKRLEELEAMNESGEIETKGKKYASVLRREMSKLQKNLGGIRTMTRVPDAMIVIDPRREQSAMREAKLLGLPVITFQDTDSDPDESDIVIPGNDDAMRSIQLVCSKMMDAILEGRSRSPMSADQAAKVTPKPAKPVAPARPSTPAPAPAAPEPAAAAPAPEAAPAPQAPATEA
jgi:small subunit ribosomal protein S2